MIGRIARHALTALLVVPSSVLAAQTGWVTMSDSARLYYRMIGRGADTIIAIHGGPGLDHETIFGDFKILGDKHTVIFYDQRGGGKSTLPADTGTLVAARQVPTSFGSISGWSASRSSRTRTVRSWPRHTRSRIRRT